MREVLARRAGVLVVLALVSVAPVLPQSVLTLEKSTNGIDADSPPGPVIAVGSTVTWTYLVTNGSGRAVTAIVVTDDQGVAVSCPQTSLDAGASMTCMASGTAQAGQYANVGTATGLQGAVEVSASDPSHYFGQAQTVMTLEKSTNGADADAPPGPTLAVNSTVDWAYVVTNVGSDPLVNVTVTDDQGVMPACPDTSLAPGASMTCTASGTVQPGQYANVGTAMALLPNETTVVASDPSHYFGSLLTLEKSTNGEDADAAPGPTITAGDPVSWTYVVTNAGTEAVNGVTVTDDQGVAVSCPQTSLGAGESMTCMASDTAVEGQYANVGTATGVTESGHVVMASDPSHYFGEAAPPPPPPPPPATQVPMLPAGSLALWALLLAAAGAWLLVRRSP